MRHYHTTRLEVRDSDIALRDAPNYGNAVTLSQVLLPPVLSTSPVLWVSIRGAGYRLKDTETTLPSLGEDTPRPGTLGYELTRSGWTTLPFGSYLGERSRP